MTPTIDQIKRAVCERFGVSHIALISQRQYKGWVRARHVAMYLARELTPCSYPEIGRGFGNRDHTTVMYAVAKIEELSRSDYDLGERVSSLKAELGRTIHA